MRLPRKRTERAMTTDAQTDAQRKNGQSDTHPIILFLTKHFNRNSLSQQYEKEKHWLGTFARDAS